MSGTPASDGARGTPRGEGKRGTRRVLRYPDLRATVYPYRVPPGLAAELPGLYDSAFATLDWFLAWDRRLPTGACVLDDPRHVVFFCVDGATIEVLNKVFEMAPADAARLCRALFRALSPALRVHLEVMFPPYELELPHRRLLNHDYLMIDLPDTVSAYDASLGKSTRHTIHKHANRLRRECPDLRTEVVVPGPRAEQLVKQIADWKIARFSRLGRTTYWETEPGRAARTAALVARCGYAHVTSIAGRPAAIVLACRAGDGVFFSELAFDPAYERYGLGLLAYYWAICDAVARGTRRGNLHLGTSGYKVRLGARRVPVFTLSVFRSRLARACYAGEAARLLWSRRAVYLWGARYTGRWAARQARQRFANRRTSRWV